MEFFNKNKQDQRKIERFVLIIFSFYSVNLCFATIRQERAMWIYWAMLLAMIASWVIYLGQYRNFRTRAMFTATMIQLTIILHACNTQELLPVVSTFMVMVVLVAFYGLAELMCLPVAAFGFICFYHGVVANTFSALPQESSIPLLSQLGNVFFGGYVTYMWLRRQNENNEQVYEIIEALMDAEQSKDDFLANVSHEIRTPVNTICGMSEMALREHDLEKMRDEVFDIRDAGHDLMSLVSDILDFSQLQQGKMNIEEEAYNITSTVNDVINTALARKGDKPIELIVDCAADIPSGLLGDEKKIRRVILNLVDNAIKFTNEGGVLINVNVRKENYGVNLCISVKDTGIGISEESIEKLFESFSQVDSRRNRQEGGVGLGLAISRELVWKMGGTITVRSRLGKGSVFRFVVPQKVLDTKPIVQVQNREKLNIATYFDMEQFDMMTIRDQYTELIVHLVQQLRVKCHACRNLAELKRRESHEKFTHIFISLEEYQEDEAYFDRLAKEIKIVVVIERYNEKYIPNPDLLRLYKPLYILPVASILNGSKGSEGGRQMVRQGKFIAPNAHILVVDDNRMNIRVVEGLLKEYRIKVTYATSGREALEVVENMAYDFIFMDHMMPEMDGIETMHLIREKVGHYYQKVPIIALTANAAPGNREMFLEEGFNDFVSKPIETSVLERVLRRNLPEEKLIFIERSDSVLNGDANAGSDANVSGDADDTVDANISGNVNAGKDDVTGRNSSSGAGDSSSRGNVDSGISGKVNQDLAIGDLDVSQGLLYCGGRKQYLTIVEACCEEREEQRQQLQELFENQDWPNYTIKIHGLKSTMKSIGAVVLSDMAKALEMAGKENNIDYILQNHNGMLEEYCRVMDELEQCPLITPKRWESQPDSRSDLPDLDEQTFDELLAKLEDAMYSLDEGQMLAVLSDMEKYQYCQTALQEKLVPVRKKIERSDLMSAVDAVSVIREELKKEKEKGAANG